MLRGQELGVRLSVQLNRKTTPERCLQLISAQKMHRAWQQHVLLKVKKQQANVVHKTHHIKEKDEEKNRKTKVPNVANDVQKSKPNDALDLHVKLCFLRWLP